MTDGPQQPPPGEPPQTSSSEEKLRRLRARPSVAGERYQLDGEIGRGGMGAVLRVRDLDLQRNLAMKVVLGQGAGASTGSTPPVDPQVLQRFLDEAQITGQLDHPGVVPVHELGIDADGRVYFTMRLVKGDTADVVFAKARGGEDGWTETRALEVILKVCDTMAFAHQKGVLHRDLKPSNVMVGKFGEVYVMDWGLAKVVGEADRRDLRLRPETTVSRVLTDRSKDEADSDSPILTMDGAVVGTPCYMAPEQAEGRIEVLDQRADVYAVGAMLYQLLTGQQPYVSPGARLSPYMVLAAVRSGPPEAVHSLRKGVPAELVAICERAMAREVGRRYAAMRDLSDDLRAYLEKRVVKAYRTGPFAELSMWVRRNRALAAAMAGLVLVLVAGFVGTTAFAWRAERVAASQKQQLTEASWAAFNQADRLLAAADAASDETVRSASAWEGLLQLVRALSLDPGNGVAWERFANTATQRKAQWRTPTEVHAFVHVALSWPATVSPDGSRVLTASDEKTARLWDAASGKDLQSLPHADAVTSAAFSPDGTQVVTANRDRAARLWDVASGTELHSLRHPGAVRSAAFSPDGSRVVTTGDDKTARLWDAASGKELHSFPHASALPGSGSSGFAYWPAAFSPDGFVVVTASDKGTAKLWDAASGRELHSLLHPDSVLAPTFSPDGSSILTESGDRIARLWDVVSGKELRTFALAESLLSAEFSPDGSRIVAVPYDRQASRARSSAKLWSVSNGTDLTTLARARGILSATFSPDASLLVTTGDDKTARLWDAATGTVVQTFAPAGGMIESATFSPDGSQVLTSGRDKVARLWDVVVGKELHTIADAYMLTAAISPNGSRVVTAGANTAKLWAADTGRELREFRHSDLVATAAFSPDGSRVVTASHDKSAVVWAVASGSATQSLMHAGPVRSATFSADGARVLTASHDGTARLWDAASGTELQSFKATINPGAAWAWLCADGSRVVTSGGDNSARLWDAATGKELWAFAHANRVHSAVFSPNGAYIVTTGSEQVARLWDVASGRELREFSHPTSAAVLSATFSPDGSMVLTAGWDKAARMWDVSSGKGLRTFARSEFVGDFVGMAAFSPDGLRMVTGGWSDTVQLWDLATGKTLHAMVHGSVLSSAFSATGQQILTTGDRKATLVDVGLGRTVRRAASATDVADAIALAELMTGHMLSATGEMAALEPAAEQEARSGLQRMLDQPGPLTPLARWLTAHGPDSSAYPGAKITCRERACVLVDNGGEIHVREALHFDPTHPLVHIALAEFETVAEDTPEADKPAAEIGARMRREFLRNYDLKRLPADAAICARAASMLLAQNDKPRALIAAGKALAIDPKNADALRVQAEASR